MSSNAIDNARKRKGPIVGLALDLIPKKRATIADAIDDLHCPVCLGIQVKAITLVPCGHSLCVSCWNAAVDATNRTTCCMCGQSVTAHVVAHAVNNLVAGLVSLSPEEFERDDVEAYHKANGGVPVVHDDFPINDDHRYEATEATGAVVGRRRYDRRCKNTINATVLEATGEGEGERNAPNDTSHSRRNREAIDDIQSIGTLVRYLFTDNIKFDMAVHALRVDLSTKWDHVVAVVACFVFVAIMRLGVKELVHWISKESV
jgi:hypothetical protein